MDQPQAMDIQRCKVEEGWLIENMVMVDHLEEFTVMFGFTIIKMVKGFNKPWLIVISIDCDSSYQPLINHDDQSTQ